MKKSAFASVTLLSLFVFQGVSWAAKIPVKIKSIIEFESEEKVPFELKCQTRDNTEISLKGTSPSEHVIFTAKQLDRCVITKDKAKATVKIRLLEGRITDELKRLRVITDKTVLKLGDDSTLILISKAGSTQKNSKKRSVSAKR